MLVANWGHMPLFYAHVGTFSPRFVTNLGLQNKVLEQMSVSTSQIVLKIDVSVPIRAILTPKCTQWERDTLYESGMV